MSRNYLTSREKYLTFKNNYLTFKNNYLTFKNNHITFKIFSNGEILQRLTLSFDSTNNVKRRLPVVIFHGVIRYITINYIITDLIPQIKNNLKQINYEMY